MPERNAHTRRELLAASAKMAAVAGLVSSAGCANTRGPALAVAAGPEPPRINTDSTIRLGFIGVGGRGNNLLDQAMKQENVVVTALADPDEANMNRTIDKLVKAGRDRPEAYRGRDDYKKLLARDDVDAVMSAVPCVYHAEIYLACFAAGKHFYGEKPMVITAGEADAMVRAQKANPRVVCQIGFQRRGSSVYRQSIQQVHDGLLGPVFEGLGAWRISGGPLGRPGTGTQIWFGRREMSGDWMLEQACHTWDVMCWVADAMPVAASGRGRRDLFREMDPQRDVTDFYVAHLEFPNGMIVDFEHNWCCPKHDKDWLFNGVFERFSGLKGGIALAESSRSCTFYPREQNETPEELATSELNPTEEAVAAFFHALRTGSTPVSTVHNGRMATLTGLLVRKAVYENRRVEMKEIV